MGQKEGAMAVRPSAPMGGTPPNGVFSDSPFGALHAADEVLSECEIAVLRHVAEGKANKEIAWLLSISEETVKAHMRSLFSKLDVGDRTQAVTVAVRRGIIDL